MTRLALSWGAGRCNSYLTSRTTDDPFAIERLQKLMGTKPLRARKMTPEELAARDREKAEREAAAAAAEEAATAETARLAAAAAWALLTDEERAAATELEWAYDDDAIPEEGRWSPPAEGEPVRLFSRREFVDHARRVGRPTTGPIPDPDGMVGATVGWLRSTISLWCRADSRRRGFRREPVHFMTRPEVAEYMGLSRRGLTGVSMPLPDAVLGNRVGWLPATIDLWQTQRPGRGRYPRS